jgi:hypothetical protein
VPPRPRLRACCCCLSFQAHVLRQAGETRIGRACSAKGRNQLTAWALLNEAVADEALARFGSARYFAVRVEDVALDPDPAPTLAALIAFLYDSGDPDEDVKAGRLKAAEVASSSEAALVAAAVAAVSAHVTGRYAGAYGGGKFGDAAAQGKLIAQLGLKHAGAATATFAAPSAASSPAQQNGAPAAPTSDDGEVVVRALRRFGYSMGGWGLEERQWSAHRASRKGGA